MRAFPKPKEVRKRKPPVIYPDGPGGREVCDLKTEGGKSLYKIRLVKMWARQAHLCCLCGKPLNPYEMTFEHDEGRGMNGSHRDDRIEVEGKPINGAAHLLCNSAKGSVRKSAMQSNPNRKERQSGIMGGLPGSEPPA